MKKEELLIHISINKNLLLLKRSLKKNKSLEKSLCIEKQIKLTKQKKNQHDNMLKLSWFKNKLNSENLNRSYFVFNIKS